MGKEWGEIFLFRFLLMYLENKKEASFQYQLLFPIIDKKHDYQF